LPRCSPEPALCNNSFLRWWYNVGLTDVARYHQAFIATSNYR
jgi:hypothetical protein